MTQVKRVKLEFHLTDKMSEDIEQVYSDFWLNKESLYEYVPEGNVGDGFSIDLIQLAAYRRIVSNFVVILIDFLVTPSIPHRVEV